MDDEQLFTAPFAHIRRELDYDYHFTPTLERQCVQVRNPLQQAFSVTQRALSVTHRALPSPSELFASPSKLTAR